MSKTYNKKDWKIKSFHISDKPSKKYYVLLENRNNKHIGLVKMYFGAKKKVNGEWVPYEQYRDSTPLKYYSSYDHNDEERLNRYLNRHKPFNFNYITPNILSLLFLWN